MMTYLLIKCSHGSERTIMQRLGMTGGIKQCEETIGAFDILASLESEYEEKIISTILGMPEVKRITHLGCTDHLIGIA